MLDILYIENGRNYVRQENDHPFLETSPVHWVIGLGNKDSIKADHILLVNVGNIQLDLEGFLIVQNDSSHWTRIPVHYSNSNFDNLIMLITHIKGLLPEIEKYIKSLS